MLDGAARLGDLFDAAAEHGHARDRDDRPRQRVRRATTSTGRPRRPGSSRSSAWRPTSPRTPRGSTATGCAGPTAASDDVSGGGAYTHMTLLRRDHRGHAQPVPAGLAAPRSRASSTSRGSTGSCCTEYAKGLIATTGCPSGEVQTWLRLGKYDEARGQRRASSATSSAQDNYFVELMDHGLAIENRVRDGLLRIAKDLAPAAGRHQRPALHQPGGRRGARGAALRAVRLDDGRPEPVQVRRRRTTTSSRRPRCARCGPTSTTCARPATTPC